MWYSGRRVSARLKALSLLAWALVRTLGRRLMGRSRQGIAAFRGNYDADALPPVSAGEREDMAEFGRCIACGLCDRGESARVAASGGRYRGVMAFVLAGTRSMPDFVWAASTIEGLGDDVLRDKEQICPTRVPLVRLAGFVRDKAKETAARGLLAAAPEIGAS